MTGTRSVLFFALLILSCGMIPPDTGLFGPRRALAAGEAGDGTREIEMTVEAKEGRQFSITLDSNRTTGYQWRLARPLDERIVQLVGSLYHPPTGNLPGAGGQEEWTFLAIGEGEAEILLEYVRPWEKGQPPAAEARVRVSVKPGP